MSHFFGPCADSLRRVERGHAVDHGYFNAPKAGEIEFGLRGARVLEGDFIGAVAAVALRSVRPTPSLRV